MSEKITLKELSSYLDKLDPRNFNSNDEWIQLIAACIAVAGDNEKVKTLLENWSRLDPEYTEDRTIRSRIDSFHDTGKITAGTFYYILKENGIRYKNKKYLSYEELKKKMFPLTDIGNMNRILPKAVDNLVIINGSRPTAYLWNGKKWKEDRTDKHKHLIAKWLFEALEIEDKYWNDYFEYLQELGKADDKGIAKQRETWNKHKINCQSARVIKNCMTLIYSHPAISKYISIFDADNMMFNCNNGIIDLKTGELLPHNQKYYCRHISPIDYTKLETQHITNNTEREQYEFYRFIDRIMEESDDKLHFLRHYLGYCLTGNNDEEIFSMFVGGGQNGKGTLLSCLSYIMGDYYKTAPTKTFMDAKNGKGPGDDLYYLMGARMVVAEETRSGDKLDLEVIKGITGGDPISCRPLYGSHVEYRATYKIVISTNHKPMLRETDNSIRRRLRLVKFNYTVPDSERDNTLKKRMPQDEGNIILNWLVSGCLDYVKYGMYSAEEITFDSDDYLESEDILGDFIRECVDGADGEDITIMNIYEAYSIWGQNTYEYVMSKRQLNKKLEERGFNKKRKHDGLVFENIKFTDKGLHYLSLYDSEQIFKGKFVSGG